MRNGTDKCRFCGKRIAIITWGVHRKAVVDAEAVEVVPDPDGEDFVRIEGSKIKGREVSMDSAYDYEMAYRPHGKSCWRRPS